MRRASLFMTVMSLLGLAALQLAPVQAASTDEVTLVADPLSTWQVSGKVFALAYAGGVVYAGGSFGSVRPPGSPAGTNEQVRTDFAAFNASTGAPTNCAPNITAPSGVTSTITALELSPDGTTLYVGGRFTSVNGITVGNMVALDTASCSVKRGFPKFNGAVNAFGVTAGTIYAGGSFTKSNNQPRTRLAAFSATGQLGSWAPSVDDTVQAITVAPDVSRVYVGGSFVQTNGASAQGIVALNPDSGATVQTFPGWIDGARETVKALTHDDQYFYLASEGSGKGQFDGRIAADVYTGAMHWKDACKGATQDIEPYQGVLYSASHNHDCSTNPGGFPDYAMDGRQHLVAETIDDHTILPWFPDTDEGIGGNGLGPHALVMAAGQLWVGGEFTTVNKSPQQGLTRFPAGPDVGAPPKVTPSATSPAAGQVQVTWPASWDRDDGLLTYRLYRVGTQGPIYTTQVESRYWSESTISFTDSGLPSGSTQSYKVDVSDGINTSQRSAAATVTVS